MLIIAAQIMEIDSLLFILVRCDAAACPFTNLGIKVCQILVILALGSRLSISLAIEVSDGGGCRLQRFFIFALIKTHLGANTRVAVDSLIIGGDACWTSSERLGNVLLRALFRQIWLSYLKIGILKFCVTTRAKGVHHRLWLALESLSHPGAATGLRP